MVTPAASVLRALGLRHTGPGTIRARACPLVVGLLVSQLARACGWCADPRGATDGASSGLRNVYIRPLGDGRLAE